MEQKEPSVLSPEGSFTFGGLEGRKKKKGKRGGGEEVWGLGPHPNDTDPPQTTCWSAVSGGAPQLASLALIISKT